MNLILAKSKKKGCLTYLDMFNRTTMGLITHGALEGDVANFAMRHQEFLHVLVGFRQLMHGFLLLVIQFAQRTIIGPVGQVITGLFQFILGVALRLSHLSQNRLLLRGDLLHGHKVRTADEMQLVLSESDYFNVAVRTLEFNERLLFLCSFLGRFRLIFVFVLFAFRLFCVLVLHFGILLLFGFFFDSIIFFFGGMSSVLPNDGTKLKKYITKKIADSILMAIEGFILLWSQKITD